MLHTIHAYLLCFIARKHCLYTQIQWIGYSPMRTLTRCLIMTIHLLNFLFQRSFRSMFWGGFLYLLRCWMSSLKFVFRSENNHPEVWSLLIKAFGMFTRVTRVFCSGFGLHSYPICEILWARCLGGKLWPHALKSAQAWRARRRTDAAACGVGKAKQGKKWYA